MRALFIGLLAATLVGCTTLPDPETGAGRKPVASKVGAKKATSIKPRKTRAVAKVKTRAVAKVKYAGKARAIQPRRADPVTEKAKTAIAAMLEDPASAEFYNLKRARKKLLHKNVDTICGYVRAKKGSGGDARRMPFLYTVDDGQAYLVNGGGSQVSATVHGALCK
jgi:hypothetical protein